ncbi:hypothetical protein CJ030_MR2G024073 [Morella rubra]|uniref:Uncharacterized protein n=1 Tax=Morella rubra TaxID=262757 RepID=A0A6A1WD29_9ROSI|nr:hypothetical protein CJ030_MR2G024073 [Morella rubra]
MESFLIARQGTGIIFYIYSSKFRRPKYSKRESRYRGSGHSSQNTAKNDGQNSIRRSHEKSEREKYFSEGKRNLDVAENERERRRFHEASCHDGRESHHKRRNVSAKLSEEERAARLREMQVDAELHEEQRWKRLRKAEDDARENLPRLALLVEEISWTLLIKVSMVLRKGEAQQLRRVSAAEHIIHRAGDLRHMKGMLFGGDSIM